MKLLLIASIVFSSNIIASPCPIEDIDLRSDMSPVRSQGDSPWCTDFSYAAILENLYYKKNKEHVQFSVMDIHSYVSDLPFEKGEFPKKHFQTTRNAYYGILPLVGKKVSEFIVEDDFPFENYDLFASSNSDYKKLEKEYESDNCVNCSPNMVSIVDDIAKRSVRDPSLGDYSDYYPENAKKLKVPEHKILYAFPPVNNNEGKILIQWMGRLLKQRIPVVFSFCGESMSQAAFNTSIRKSSCTVGHSAVIVGMKTVGNSCKVILRNSEGKNWPDGEGDGHVEMDIEEAFERLVAKNIADGNPGYGRSFGLQLVDKKTDNSIIYIPKDKVILESSFIKNLNRATTTTKMKIKRYPKN